MEAKVEHTLVLVKPDGVQRGLIGEVISRLERRGLRLVAAKFMQVSNELAETHYAIHKGKLRRAQGVVARLRQPCVRPDRGRRARLRGLAGLALVPAQPGAAG